VRAVYTRPADPARPVVCLDETSRHLRGAGAPPRPVAPGTPARHADAYVRGGVCTLCLITAPLRGWRPVRARTRRARADWAATLKEWVDGHDPHAEKVVLVQDTLTIHSPASLYAAFPPAEATRLADRLEIHHPPTHGSWLTRAEIELAALSRPCLDRRLPDQETLTREVAVWEERRNSTACPLNGRFTTADARIKLKHLYPSFEDC